MAPGQQGQLQGTVNKAWDHSVRHKAVLAPVAEDTARYSLPPPNKSHSDEARLMFKKTDMSSLLKYIYCTKK